MESRPEKQQDEVLLYIPSITNLSWNKNTKEWYENPDNFPCIVISLKTNKPHIAYSYNHLEEKIKQETFSAKPDKFRPATKEEVLALLVKE